MFNVPLSNVSEDNVVTAVTLYVSVRLSCSETYFLRSHQTGHRTASLFITVVMLYCHIPFLSHENLYFSLWLELRIIRTNNRNGKG